MWGAIDEEHSFRSITVQRTAGQNGETFVERFSESSADATPRWRSIERVLNECAEFSGIVSFMTPNYDWQWIHTSRLGPIHDICSRATRHKWNNSEIICLVSHPTALWRGKSEKVNDHSSQLFNCHNWTQNEVTKHFMTEIHWTDPSKRPSRRMEELSGKSCEKNTRR